MTHGPSQQYKGLKKKVDVQYVRGYIRRAHRSELDLGRQIEKYKYIERKKSPGQRHGR